MTNPTFKNCPFCGENPEIISNVNDVILIRCSTLGCVAWQHRVDLEQWNNRPTQQITGSRDKLAEIIKKKFFCAGYSCTFEGLNKYQELADAIIRSMPDWAGEDK